ncbi:nuclease [Sulfolobus islandicus rod-shaped virus]|nr:nuclease [Sulfolobus islandicus rod-shaped virus]
MTNYEEFVKQSFKMKYPEDTIFPSEIGICFRKSYFSRKFEFEKAVNEISLDLGEQYHEKVEHYFEEKLGCKSEIEIKGEIENIKISGRVDLICNNDLIELKTITSNYFNIKEYHLYQVSIYYYLLQQQNYKINNVYIIYLNRINKEVRQFQIDKKVLDEYMKKTIDWIKKFKEFMKLQDYKIIPGANNYLCKNCEFKAKCFGSLF